MAKVTTEIEATEATLTELKATKSNATNTMTSSAKAGLVALKGLTLAGNMVVGILAGFVISKAIEGFDTLIHRVDNVKDALEEFNSSVKEQKDNLSTQESVIMIYNGSKWCKMI